MIVELKRLSSVEIEAIIFEGVAELARRAGNDEAVSPVPVQLELMAPPEPIDLSKVDMSEILADGFRRYMTPKEAAPLTRCGDDKLRNLIREKGAGFITGNRRYIVDRLRVFTLV